MSNQNINQLSITRLRETLDDSVPGVIIGFVSGISVKSLPENYFNIWFYVELFFVLLILFIGVYVAKSIIEAIRLRDYETLTSEQEVVLRAFSTQRETVGSLANTTGYPQVKINDLLEELQQQGKVQCVHAGSRLYELKPEGSSDGGSIQTTDSSSKSENPNE